MALPEVYNVQESLTHENSKSLENPAIFKIFGIYQISKILESLEP